jgi:hypothetical protein
MSTISLTNRLRQRLLGAMLALTLAFMGTAAASAAPLKLICEDGDQPCAGSTAVEPDMATTIYLPLISGGGEVMAAADGTVYLCVLEPDGSTK